MKTASNLNNDLSLTVATTLSSIGAFIVGLIKQADWVLISSVGIPLLIGFLNIIYRHREAKKNTRIQDLKIQQEEAALRQQQETEAHIQRMHEQEFQLAQRTADRRLELDYEISQRTIQLQQQKIEALTKIANELHLASEEDKRQLINALMEQIDGDIKNQPNLT